MSASIHLLFAALLIAGEVAAATKSAKSGSDCKLNPDIQADIAKYVKQQPLCAGFLDVTLPPYNAKGDGVTDDTTAVLQAIQDAFKNDLVTFFPANKRFLISKQIRMIQTSISWEVAWDGYQLLGSTKGKPPVLVLKDGSTVQDNIFVYFRTFDGKKDDPPNQYSDMIRGIHIDMGNNPGVSALSMSGAQRCTIEDVYISGRAFYAGLQGIPGSGGFSGNIEVNGGQIGLWQEQFRPNPSITNLVLRNQSLTGVWHEWSRGPLVLSGFEIWSPDAPAANYRAIRVHGESGRKNMLEGDGSLALEDGLVVVKGEQSVAVETIEANLAFRNVFFQAKTTVQETTRHTWKNPKPSDLKTVLTCHGSGTKAWNHIANWVRTEKNSHIKVGGKASVGPTASYPPSDVAHACGNSAGPPSGLRTLHSWDPALMPSWQDDDLIDIVTDYGATQHWVRNWDDDGAKIQRALNDAADPKHAHYGKTVYIPFGDFHSLKTISVPAGSRILGAGKQSRIEMRHKAGVWSAGQPLIVSEDADAPAGRKYGLVLLDFHLNTHSRGQAFDLRTNKILFKGVISTDDGLNSFSLPPLAPKSVLSGNAGGHFYTLNPGVLNLDPTGPADWGPTFSLLRVTGTSNPIHLYELDMEHQAGNFQMLIDNSANVHIHAFKYESVGIGIKHTSKHAKETDRFTTIGGSLAAIRNSVGITMFGGSGNYALNHPNISRTLLDFRNTTGIELWQMVRRAEGGHEIKDGDWVQLVGADGERLDALSDDYNILYYNDQKSSATVPDTTAATPAAPDTTAAKSAAPGTTAAKSAAPDTTAAKSTAPGTTTGTTKGGAGSGVGKPGTTKPSAGTGGGLRLQSANAAIELGSDGDVKLVRSGAGKLMIHGDLTISGGLDAKSVSLGDMDLGEYIQKLVKEILKK